MNGTADDLSIFRVKDFPRGELIALCTTRIALKACDPVQLKEGFLPSDGSGIDPHATLLVVQPVPQTGQRRAEERRGGRGGPVVCQTVSYS